MLEDYRLGAVSSRRLAGQSNRSQRIDLAAVVESGEAERLSDALLRDIWAGRERADIELPPSALAIEAGDVLTLPGAAQGERLLAERIEDGASRSLALRRFDGRGLGAARPPDREPPEPVIIFGKPTVRIVDFAPPDGVEAQAPRLAVFSDPWPGTVAVYRATEGGGFGLIATVTTPATMGKLTAPLGAGPLGLFDWANAIEVALLGGALSSLPDIDVLGGGNAAAVRTAGGAWEVLQFASAELIGVRRYRLTRLLRGQCGSEQAMEPGAATGADFVLLDRAVLTLPVRVDQLGLPLRYRFGPARDDHAAPTFLQQTIVAEGEGLVPFAPVHLSAHRETSGDVALSWVRRTRFGGVGWELVEVPLNEEREAYRLEILDGADVVRTIETNSPAYDYSAAHQTTDFGSLPSELAVRVAQMSATVGQGRALETVVQL